MPESDSSAASAPRVRFAPSPTGFLHVGSARTFIFNWLYARHNGGTMVLRLDDTDVERNTEASVQSIFEGLRWLGLDWDEEYKQSERLDLHRAAAEAIFAKGLAYRDFTPAHADAGEQSSAQGAWLFNPGMRDLSQRSQRPPRRRWRAVRAPLSCPARRRPYPPALSMPSTASSPSSADEVEDFALLRSDGMPTYHLASCVDDADLRITHIIRGQDHLTNTFKHLLIFEGLGVAAAPIRASPAARRPRRRQALQAQARPRRQRDHLSRRRVSRRTPSSTSSACSAGRPRTTASSWPSTKSARPSLWKTSTAPTPLSISQKKTPSTPKPSGSTPSIIRALAVDAAQPPACSPSSRRPALKPTPEKLLAVTPLIRERIKLLRDAVSAADFFFVNELAPYDPAELIPQRRRCRSRPARSCSTPRKSSPQPPSITIRSTRLCEPPLRIWV